jgi:lysophospholipase L1-like esterase
MLLIEVKMAMSGPKEPPFVNPNHDPVQLGHSGPHVTYVVIGDSTAAGRGAPYKDGIALGTASYLARNQRVVLTNFAISGATAADVVKDQIQEAARLRPDIVLVSVGANDATHFTSGASLTRSLNTIIDTLRGSSAHVKIIVTGCPQMGSIPRFKQPLRWFAGTQTARLNAVFARIVAQKNVTWAHIADDTGPIFARDPTLFAADNFHPNSRGYAVWIPVIDRAMDTAEAVKETP